jgi:hypothetical protein
MAQLIISEGAEAGMIQNSRQLAHMTNQRYDLINEWCS